MSGEDVRLWGTPSESIRPERVLKDIGASGVRKVREAIRTYSDPSLAYQKVAANYQPEKLWEANLSFFKVRSVLGAGSFGTVFRGYNEKEKSKCAIKLVRTYKRDIDMIKREIRALGTLHHPNIVHLYCACITNDGVLTLIMPALYPLGKIVMEILAEQKEDRETKEVFQIFSEDVVHNIIQQVCCGLAFMHSHKFVHRDLKADNFLFDKEGTIKIADFGLSRKYTPAENSLGLLKTPCGTKLFMAPEVAKRYFDRSAAAYDIRAETWQGIFDFIAYYSSVDTATEPSTADEESQDETDEEDECEDHKCTENCWECDIRKRVRRFMQQHVQDIDRCFIEEVLDEMTRPLKGHANAISKQFAELQVELEEIAELRKAAIAKRSAFMTDWERMAAGQEKFADIVRAIKSKGKLYKWATRDPQKTEEVDITDLNDGLRKLLHKQEKLRKKEKKKQKIEAEKQRSLEKKEEKEDEEVEEESSSDENPSSNESMDGEIVVNDETVREMKEIVQPRSPTREIVGDIKEF
uniref:non-specific serine/threonine protein kinase n=1 Tax=Bursaphelenchus xylophilus TaxID=6326 RepID=A0A1I7RWG6_BURXY